MPEILPNLIIGGAPKCGTTALATYLGAHPNVCNPTLKETLFLQDADNTGGYDQRYSYHTRGLAGYARYFPDYDPQQHRVLYDATPHYIYQQTAQDVLATFPRPVQIVFLVRRPAERIYSLFRYAQNHQAQLNPDMTFADFVAMLHSDKQPQQLSLDLRTSIERSRYINYIEQWLATGLPITVYTTEELFQNPQRIVCDLARRLDLAPDFYETYAFQQVNTTRHFRNHRIHHLINRLKQLLPYEQQWRIIHNTPVRYLRQLYRAMNTDDLAPKSLADKAAIVALNREFAADNQRLAQLLEIDLTHWADA